jgi:hypothetical protein
MKFFAIFFLIMTAGSAVFYFVDGPDSGMQYAALGFGVIGSGVLLYNTRKNGAWLNDSTNR